jgi:thiol-disulfide isomerase/thioredoxin
MIELSNQYQDQISEKEKGESLANTRELLIKISQEYNEAIKEIVNKELENSDDPVYKVLLLDVYGHLMDPEDFISYANIFLLQANDSILAYKNIVDQKNKYIQQLSVEVGRPLIDFTLKDLKGNPIDLASITKKNEYTLLDFWASWCGPCRTEMPVLKKVYDTFHSKGFEIFMVSIDSNYDKWVEASVEENLSWINTFDDKSVSSLYAVKVIPQNFLISKNGEIIDINLRGDVLKARLEELLEYQ